ncbi:MAG: GSCFA domain-containing protein [Candidatus Binatia bacterium]
MSEVKLLKLESWRLYPTGDELSLDFLKRHRPQHPRIDRKTLIASIGSCFAREIKYWLKKRGYCYLQTAEGPCTEAGSARFDRVYNTFTLRQEFERAFGTFAPQEPYWDFVENGKRRLLDPYRKNVAWDTEEEMNIELEEHRRNVRLAFSTCHVLIITLGQTEIWYHKPDGYVYPLIPPVQIFSPAKHGFRLSTYEENLENLERVYKLFITNNPNAYMIATVSPVPLRATFQQTNSLIANVACKSVLRATVEAFVQRHAERVIYFPSYEVTTLIDKDSYKDDNRHVKTETIDRIMELFEAWFVA